MEIREELHINCHPALAFDLMADVRRITEWNGGASSAEMLSPEPIGVGSRFSTVNRGQTLESTIRTFERPDLLEFDVTGKAMDVAGTFAFTETDEGTRLDLTFTPQPKGVMAFLFPLLSPIIKRDLRKQHEKFKVFCESQTQPHDV